MKKGKIIVIEGACDGIGKSTQLSLLKEYLDKKYNVVTHHFPTYNEASGMLVEKYLNGDFGDIKDVTPYFVNSLYGIDRAIVSKNKIKPALEDGDVVILDRYTTSSIIYQSATIGMNEKEKFIKYVCDYEYEKLGVIKPDVVIFLTAPYDLVTEMRSKRQVIDGIKNDIHERNDEYMRKVYESGNYAAKLLNWEIINCDKDGKMLSIEEIHEEIKKRINM